MQPPNAAGCSTMLLLTHGRGRRLPHPEGGTFEVLPEGAGCRLTRRSNVQAVAGRGLMWPRICGRWLPVRLPDFC